MCYSQQAWCFATGVRLCLGKVPYMNMHKFDKDIWFLHRRLFHRFIKYAKYFRLATEELSVFQTATNEESIVSSKKRKREEEIQVISYDIHICYSHMLFTYAIHMVFLC